MTALTFKKIKNKKRKKNIVKLQLHEGTDVTTNDPAKINGILTKAYTDVATKTPNPDQTVSKYIQKNNITLPKMEEDNNTFTTEFNSYEIKKMPLKNSNSTLLREIRDRLLTSTNLSLQ